MPKKTYYATQPFFSPYLKRAIKKGSFKKGEKVELNAKTAEMFKEHFSDKPPKEKTPTPSSGKPSTTTGAPAAAKEK